MDGVMSMMIFLFLFSTRPGRGKKNKNIFARSAGVVGNGFILTIN